MPCGQPWHKRLWTAKKANTYSSFPVTKDNLKIVFFGTPEFAVESLSRLVDDGFNVAAVVTMPDKVAGRGHRMITSAVKDYAVAHGLPVLQPVSLKDPAFLEELRSFDAQLFIVIAFRMLPQAVWQMPPLGTFNLHASLLPRYRGAAPINWAVINGDKETGVTTFFLKHEIDTGDILRQERIAIAPDENAGSVHDRLMALGADLTVDTVRHILAGDLKPVSQSDLLQGQEPTPAPKIFRDTCRVDWRRPAEQVHNLVRGLAPYPAAWSTLVRPAGNLDVKILATALTTGQPVLAQGEIAVKGSKMLVGTATQPVEVLELKPEGKKAMAAGDFLRGNDVAGCRFEV